ncbi:hypothetical protein Fcan01_13523 [Folsomia candida]|uniref:Uncharacterized protein n=1 Tax=Folsomia candida TaxID=158441 RepID=A0A226E3H9_FOLCA|nr:hypothetical protein Fcan01_13523 [Folsomia candida]
MEKIRKPFHFRCIPNPDPKVFKIMKLCLLLAAGRIIYNPTTTYASRFESRLQYENHCGDLAIACVASCPAFRHRCYASHVADSIREATGATPLPIVPIITGHPLLPECVDDSKNRRYCIRAKDHERPDDCCPGMSCVPFKHVDGRSSVLGYCYYLNK